MIHVEFPDEESLRAAVDAVAARHPGDASDTPITRAELALDRALLEYEQSSEGNSSSPTIHRITIVAFEEGIDFGEDQFTLDINGTLWFYTVISGPDCTDYRWSLPEEPQKRSDGPLWDDAGPLVAQDKLDDFTERVGDLITEFNLAYREWAIELHLAEIMKNIAAHAIEVANRFSTEESTEGNTA